MGKDKKSGEATTAFDKVRREYMRHPMAQEFERAFAERDARKKTPNDDVKPAKSSASSQECPRAHRR